MYFYIGQRLLYETHFRDTSVTCLFFIMLILPEDTLFITQLQHKFVDSANRMYNRLVVPLNRYNNFAGLLHSLDVFLGKEGATQLPARDSHRLTPLVAAGAESLSIRRSNRFWENSCVSFTGIRSRPSNSLFY